MAVKVREKVKGSGEWWIYIDHQGKRKAKKVGRDKRKAKEVAELVQAKLKLGEFDIHKEKEAMPIFREYAETWITVTVPATCKRSTAYGYKGILNNHILPVFGNLPVNEIKKSRIKTFLMKKYRSGVSASKVNHLKVVISGVLNLAVDDEVIPANPAHRLGKIYHKQQAKDEIDPLTREELSHLLTVFRLHYSEHYPMALLLARTGMRLGEVLALKWEDIDFKGRFIYVVRGFSMGEIDTPKSNKSRRVDMSLQLSEALKSLKLKRKVLTIKKGWEKVPEWIFINRDGKTLDKNNWRKRVFYKALDKAGMRRIRIHDLRHTFASLLIQAGESLVYVRDQLGHHSIQITVDIYGHLAPEGNKAAVDRLDDNYSDATIRNLSATNKKGVAA
jgi:integrase